MKKNSNGFTILETLITSTLVISTLVFLYVQFNNLERNYDDSFRFNTVNGIHKAKELSKYYQANPDNHFQLKYPVPANPEAHPAYFSLLKQALYASYKTRKNQ